MTVKTDTSLPSIGGGHTTRVPHRKYGDPEDELPVKNAKYRRETDELYMGGKGIEKLDEAQFKKFPNLEVLWLTNNKLTKIKGLDFNFRLKKLYLQDNNIASVCTPSCSLKKLHHLEVLLLSNNRLQDLAQTLHHLSHLSFLQQLDLFGNPLAEEINYRPTVVYNMPHLHVFDRHEVTERELTAATKFFKVQKIEKKYAFGQLVQPWEKPEVPPKGALSVCEGDLYRDRQLVLKNRVLKAQMEEEEGYRKAAETAFLYTAKDKQTGAVATSTLELLPRGRFPEMVVHVTSLTPTDALMRDTAAQELFVEIDFLGIPEQPLCTRRMLKKKNPMLFRFKESVTEGRASEAFGILTQALKSKRKDSLDVTFTLKSDEPTTKRTLGRAVLPLRDCLKEASDSSYRLDLEVKAKGGVVLGNLAAVVDTDWNIFPDFKDFLKMANRKTKASKKAGHDLTGDLKVDAARLFKQFDTDGGGSLGKEELKLVLEQLGRRPTIADVEELMSVVDKDGGGDLSVKEFTQALGKFEDIFYSKAKAAMAEQQGPAAVHEEVQQALRMMPDLLEVKQLQLDPPKIRTNVSHDVLAKFHYRYDKPIDNRDQLEMIAKTTNKAPIQFDDKGYTSFMEHKCKLRGARGDVRNLTF